MTGATGESLSKDRGAECSVIHTSLPDRSPKRALMARSRFKVLAILIPVLFYVAGLNPYYSPGTYDDVVYHLGAVSLAETGRFMLDGMPIVDWPPGFPAVLAGVFLTGLQSVWAGKILVVLCAAAGLALCFRLFQLEGRRNPVVILLLFALLPVSMMAGTRLMAEWPFFLMSILFLLSLEHLRQRRSWPAAVICGALLGATALTKFVGVLLGAAIVAQAIMILRSDSRRRPWRRLSPELIAALIGGSVFLAWKLKVRGHLQEGAAVTDYYGSGWITDRLHHLNIPGFFECIGELFFHIESAGQFLGVHAGVAGFAAMAIGLMTLFGFVERIRMKRLSPSDAYVAAVLALFSTLGDNQQIRYLMPVAPFLIHYFLTGCERLWSVLRSSAGPRRAFAFRAFVGGWMLLHAASCFQVLLFGNLSRTHAGLFYPASPTPESFYKGYWLDLYQACERIRTDPAPGPVALVGEDDKYVTAFTGRDWVRFGSGEEFTYLLVMDRGKMPEDSVDALGLVELMKGEHVSVYRRELRSLSGI